MNILIVWCFFQGYEYCFISNIDNLGATVDINILDLIIKNASSNPREYVIEITDKTRADIKVSTLFTVFHLRCNLIVRAEVKKCKRLA